MDNVGIRSRGHGSRSPIKPNLRVDVNRYAPGQTFLGLGSFVLKANNQDASMLKERSVFKLWDRTGLPASRETFARLYVNNVYYGVFLLTEELRTEYTQRYLNDTNGDLYEWKPINDGYHFEWNPTCTDKIPQACSTDPAKWAPFPWNPEENKATYDMTPTISMIRDFTQVADADFEKTISAQMDLKLWAFHNAIENYVADYDSILGDVFGMNNFWIYRYAGTNFHQFLLWDKDSSYDYAGRSIFQNADRNVLMKRTLALPNRRAQYLESEYKTAVLAGGAGGWLEWEIKREYDLASGSIREDPFKQYGDAGVTKDSNNELFEAQVLKDYKFVQDQVPVCHAGTGDRGNSVSHVAHVDPGWRSQCCYQCGWPDCTGLVRQPLRVGIHEQYRIGARHGVSDEIGRRERIRQWVCRPAAVCFSEPD